MVLYSWHWFFYVYVYSLTLVIGEGRMTIGFHLLTNLQSCMWGAKVSDYSSNLYSLAEFQGCLCTFILLLTCCLRTFLKISMWYSYLFLFSVITFWYHCDFQEYFGLCTTCCTIWLIAQFVLHIFSAHYSNVSNPWGVYLSFIQHVS